MAMKAPFSFFNISVVKNIRRPFIFVVCNFLKYFIGSVSFDYNQRLLYNAQDACILALKEIASE